MASSRTVDEELRRILDVQPWEAHLARLTAYALGKIWQRYWRGERSGCPPGGKEAADFALEAVCSVYAGSRRWSPEQNPDIFGYLCDVIDSLISNAVTALENQDERLEEDPYLSDSANTPVDLVPEQEADQGFVRGFLDGLSEEPELQQVVQCIVKHGCSKPAEIAETLHLSPKEVTNRRKRLRRRLIHYRAKIDGAVAVPAAHRPPIDPVRRTR